MDSETYREKGRLLTWSDDNSNSDDQALPMKKTLISEPIYGGPVTNESEKAWDDLMPLGRGFVVIKNQTALPQVPKFNATMGEYKGVISVFHQLHCVWATREAFFKLLREGNSTEIDLGHLSHCWDFVRQAIQCRADTTIEWQVSEELGGSLGWGYQHQCYDYDALKAWAEGHSWGDDNEKNIQ
ncbi:Oxidase ustYa [Colletotrichum fructicola]|nr:Oxidase ustYa [Colletotrichum fructicola]KAF4889571.1 Oxidase ustYa [Colletotrichum fructicola]KAF4925076.1 Oxidase ustYa [Colletotrichum fructicola]